MSDLSEGLKVSDRLRESVLWSLKSPKDSESEGCLGSLELTLGDTVESLELLSDEIEESLGLRRSSGHSESE